MRRPWICLLPLCLVSSACLEIEEVLDVSEDGAVVVTVTAQAPKDNAADLTDGAPLPAHGPWQPLDATTRAWLAGGPPPDETRVGVRAHFDALDELPRFYASNDDPYRTAGLERTTTLRIEHRGTRTLYHFERVYGARRHRDWDTSTIMEGALGEELGEALDASLESGVPMPPEQLADAVARARQVYRSTARTVARGAVAAVYLEGDGELALDAYERILARVELDVGAAISEDLLHGLYAELLGAKDDPEFELSEEHDLDRVSRAVLRGTLPEALAAEGVTETVRNGVLARLEWSFSAMDRTGDLDDESFTLRVGLPGRIVDGNFDGIEAGRAVWRHQGDALHDRDLVLRAVSVLE